MKSSSKRQEEGAGQSSDNVQLVPIVQYIVGSRLCPVESDEQVEIWSVEQLCVAFHAVEIAWEEILNQPKFHIAACW